MDIPRMPRLLALVVGATASFLVHGAHGQEISLTKSEFVKLFNAVSNVPCSTWPGEPPPEGILIDPEGCQHWLEMIAAFAVADVAIDRALTQQRVGDALGGGGSDAVLVDSL